MKIYPDKLQGQLAREILSFYIVSGDELLLVQESCDLIRDELRKAGFSERDLFHIDNNFEWQQVTYSNGSMSLFADKKIIELRMSSAKPGKEGAVALTKLCANLSEDNCILLVLPRLDAATQRTKWFKTLEGIGGFVQVWPIDANQLPRWIENRFKRVGLTASREAVQALAERIEGNLLAAVQEIERMKLCSITGHIEIDEVMGGVADSARYDVFLLIDAALEGNTSRVVRILDGLYLEGAEPLFLNNMLAREIRNLSVMAHKIDQGQSVDAVLRSGRIWDKRKAPVAACLRRHRATDLERMQSRFSRVDLMVKGLEDTGRPWDELTTMVVELSQSIT